MARQTYYALNTSETDQLLQHPLLKNQYALPVAPMGEDMLSWVRVNGQRVVIPAGSAFILPREVWVTGRGAWRREWIKEITEEEFAEMLGKECVSEPKEAEASESAEIPEGMAVCPFCEGEGRVAVSEDSEEHVREEGEGESEDESEPEPAPLEITEEPEAEGSEGSDEAPTDDSTSDESTDEAPEAPKPASRRKHSK